MHLNIENANLLDPLDVERWALEYARITQGDAMTRAGIGVYQIRQALIRAHLAVPNAEAVGEAVGAYIIHTLAAIKCTNRTASPMMLFPASSQYLDVPSPFGVPFAGVSWMDIKGDFNINAFFMAAAYVFQLLCYHLPTSGPTRRTRAAGKLNLAGHIAIKEALKLAPRHARLAGLYTTIEELKQQSFRG